ncbi:hypothetical protein UFOVP1601_6 [uncultured Caudovirales phage]|uniref:Uncharacterized protein n=1 Tax=uncultured Caudovirales phage TaxID=2100421 RepID=A0A6J5QXL0_9CAUD|nr:hypothetical protein UFOVP1154_16 [uncultured Caudovirales phage]CAB4200095.1 hypothetical protein UFOVP1341_21 [uncultured Caudovirales phage]CAB4218228.1 hypothetical protein UFOVP1601_6 [uncultured Caudovirales phage]
MSVFQSFMSEQLEEAKAVGEVERLLEEHAKSRELATLAMIPPAPVEPLGHDLVDATTPSAPRALPELTAADKLRLGQIMALIRGPHTKAVLKVVRRYMPDLFAAEPSS